MIRDFTQIHKKYRGKWVALTLDEKEVIASGGSLAQILEKSKRKGLAHPIVMKIPKEVIPLVSINFQAVNISQNIAQR